jgi:hypothetical protein
VTPPFNYAMLAEQQKLWENTPMMDDDDEVVLPN